MIADVYTSGLSAEDVAGQWANRVNEDGPAAMVEFVNFLLRSSGCKIEVIRDDIDDVDNVSARVGDLQDEYQTVSRYTWLCAIILTTNSKMSRIIHSSRKAKTATHFGSHL